MLSSSSLSLTSIHQLLVSLQTRANRLLDALQSYQAVLAAHSRLSHVKLGPFKRRVEAEARSLNAISVRDVVLPKPSVTTTTLTTESDDNEINSGLELEDELMRVQHALSSSNLLFYEAVWTVMCANCEAVVALSKRVTCFDEEASGKFNSVAARKDSTHDGDEENSNTVTTSPVRQATNDHRYLASGMFGSSSGSGITSSAATVARVPQLVRKPVSKPKSAVVDIVARNGLEWIKVSTITEKRLLFEIAKEGWEKYADTSDDDSHSDADEFGASHDGKQGGMSPGGTGGTISNPQLRHDSGALKHHEADQRSQLELVRLAHVLCAASRERRVQFQHPRVRFVLPRIREGLYNDVDAVIAEIRSIGVRVDCCASEPEDLGPVTSTLTVTTATEIPDSNRNVANLLAKPRLDFSQAPDIPDAFLDSTDTGHDFQAVNTDYTHLLPSLTPFGHSATSDLNIDCTILLSLVSDISHISSDSLRTPSHKVSGENGTAISTPTSYHKAISRQIEVEQATPLLPVELYPILVGKFLRCTQQAAQRMQEIVDTMGTDTERQRTRILLGTRTGVAEGVPEHQSQQQHDNGIESKSSLRDALAAISCHHVPTDLLLPVQIVDFAEESESEAEVQHPTSQSDGNDAKFGAADVRVMSKLVQRMQLSAINRSVFLFGWRRGSVTVTSNRGVAQGIVKCINEILDEEEHHQLTPPSIVAKNSSNRTSGSYPGQLVDSDVMEFRGPQIYICKTARSLIGKEKQDHKTE